MNFDPFFKAKSIAVIGASRESGKVGNVIIRNLVDGRYGGKIFPINPKANEILGLKTYDSVASVQEKIELAVIAVPTELVFRVLDECRKKNVKNVIIVTAGFREVGNSEGEEKLKKMLKQYKIRAIGPNCLGTFNSYTRLDTMFLPRYRLTRPGKGGISFICQSGAVGSAILDLATSHGYGFAKFASYGNATDVDESDLLEYMGNDRDTKVVCMYIEGVKDGKKFLETAKRVTKKKPVIVIKGGITAQGSHAILSHTGSLAGSADIYFGAFKQGGIIRADSLYDMFNYARVLETCVRPKGRRVQIITNGGGYGVLSTDYIVANGLQMAEMKEATRKSLRSQFPKIVNIGNPLDLVGDATTERYRIAMEAALGDDAIDSILLIALYQTPRITTDIVDMIVEMNDRKKKPIIVVSTGGEFTELLSKNLEANGIPTFEYPEAAVRSITALTEYYGK
ncbi:MAG: CoA-binding protein [Candidatus Aenigmarchaeota archaeon]|nr:CoA-binding protein [Candidatus Aenigmarchaeota archaeon]